MLHRFSFKRIISARLSNILRTELAQKTARAEPSRAGTPLARAESELSRAELNSVATLEMTNSSAVSKLDLNKTQWAKMPNLIRKFFLMLYRLDETFWHTTGLHR